MIRHIALLLAAAAVPMVASASPDRPPKLLKREGHWVANFDRDSCQLLAIFGPGDDKLIARFTRFEPGDSFHLVVFGKQVPRNGVREDAKIDFGLAGKPDKSEVMLGKFLEQPAVFFSGLRLDGWLRRTEDDVPPVITPEQEASVREMTVSIRGKSWRLAFGSMRKPMETMRTCLDNLVHSWGYDPKMQASLSRPVTPDGSPGRWLESSDYPVGSLIAGHSGTVQFRLDVDATGKIAGCYVLERTEPDDFATLTCKAVSRRAKLLPALDAEGKPVRSYYVQKVKWLAG